MKYKHTKYQITLHETKYPIINNNPTSPVDEDTVHGDTSSLGILGRFGVSPREE